MKNKGKDPRITAGISAIVSGLVIHMFGLVTILSNYDNIAAQPRGYGTGITSGRWMLTLMGDFCDRLMLSFNLPWVNGILSILIMAAAVYVIADIFEIRSHVMAAVLGAAWISFPTFTSMLVFRFTVQYYCAAVLFTVLAAWLVIKAKKHYIWAALLSGLLTACALGVYQAFLPITISLLVLSLMQQILKNRDLTARNLIARGIYYCIALILGLAFYAVILKICLGIYQVTLSDYQGISNMGKLSLGQILRSTLAAYRGFARMPSDNLYSLAPIPLIAGLYKLLAAASLVLLLTILLKKKLRGLQCGLLFLLCAVFPAAVNFIVIMCPETSIYTLMQYSFVCILLLPVILLEELPELEGKAQKTGHFGKVLVTAALCLMIFAYAYWDNVNYTHLYYANRQAENYVSGMITQVRMTEGFSQDKKWVLLGEPHDRLLRGRWRGILYGGFSNSDDLISTYSWKNWIVLYTGYQIPEAEEAVREEVANREQVRNMPCWPDYGSIQVIDDLIVIKFTEARNP